MRVIIESPYAGDIEKNLLYVRMAMRDCLARGEHPFASHALYTQVLDDRFTIDRGRGIAAGIAWLEVADCTVVYCDLGLSAGMKHGIEKAFLLGKSVHVRSLLGWETTLTAPTMDAVKRIVG